MNMFLPTQTNYTCWLTEYTETVLRKGSYNQHAKGSEFIYHNESFGIDFEISIYEGRYIHIF